MDFADTIHYLLQDYKVPVVVSSPGMLEMLARSALEKEGW